MDAYGRINNSSRVVYRQLSFHQWMNSVIKLNQKYPYRIPKTIAECVQWSRSHPTSFVKFGPSLILAVIYPFTKAIICEITPFVRVNWENFIFIPLHQSKISILHPFVYWKSQFCATSLFKRENCSRSPPSALIIGK